MKSKVTKAAAIKLNALDVETREAPYRRYPDYLRHTTQAARRARARANRLAKIRRAA